METKINNRLKIRWYHLVFAGCLIALDFGIIYIGMPLTLLNIAMYTAIPDVLIAYLTMLYLVAAIIWVGVDPVLGSLIYVFAGGKHSGN
jgi:hypothetical protein